ncbi:MAG: hypothetical protein IJ184_01070 [Alphaproteobacteria bacterium]|nr:hypothetical protein [Alphaproteobacteria bacterium]
MKIKIINGLYHVLKDDAEPRGEEISAWSEQAEKKLQNDDDEQILELFETVSGEDFEKQKYDPKGIFDIKASVFAQTTQFSSSETLVRPQITPENPIKNDLATPPNEPEAGFKCYNSGFTFTELPEDVSAEREIHKVYVKKNDAGQLQFYSDKEYKNKITDLVNEYAGRGSNNGGKCTITMHEVVFMYNTPVTHDDLQENPAVKELTDKNDKMITVSHELQHIINRKNVAALSGSPNVSLNDYVRVCYFDEVTATMKPLLDKLAEYKNASNPNEWINHQASEHQAIFQEIRKDKDLDASIKNGTPDWNKLLRAVTNYWDEKSAKLYVGNDTDNNQFKRHLNHYILNNPYNGQNVADNSPDYQAVLGAMLNQFDNPFQKGEKINFDLNGLDFPDPMKAHASEINQWLPQIKARSQNRYDYARQAGFTPEIISKLRGGHSDAEGLALNENSPIPNQSNEQQTSQTQEPDTSHTPLDDDKRQFYRRYFQEVARRDNLTYGEDENAIDYSASLKTSTGETTHISIRSDNNLIMNSSDNAGHPKVPEQQRFDDIAQLAKQQNQSINFGNITSPEYKARLYLACLKANVKMTNYPQISEEFLNSLSPETKQGILSYETQRKVENNKERIDDFHQKMEKMTQEITPASQDEQTAHQSTEGEETERKIAKVRDKIEQNKQLYRNNNHDNNGTGNTKTGKSADNKLSPATLIGYYRNYSK